ncbi:MAG: Uma2 family endonuclease [Candidatus Poribacteria bacterium]
MTVEQFYNLVEDGQKADLIDGVIYLDSPDSRISNQLTNFLSRIMGFYCEMKDLGEIFSSRFAFTLSETNAPEPDVAFVRRERLHLVHANGMKGGPDIAVEIVSRESRHRDYIEKKQLYQDAGVLEYWIIDPLQRRAGFYRLHENRYELVPLERNRIFRSTTMKDFWLDVFTSFTDAFGLREWLFTEPLPKSFEIIQEILENL